jgi:hypothetical protein
VSKGGLRWGRFALTIVSHLDALGKRLVRGREEDSLMFKRGPLDAGALGLLLLPPFVL